MPPTGEAANPSHRVETYELENVLDVISITVINIVIFAVVNIVIANNI